MTGLVYEALGVFDYREQPRRASDFQAAFNNGDKLREDSLWIRLKVEGPDSPNFRVYVRAIRDLQIHEEVYARGEGREPAFAGPDIRDCRDNYAIAEMMLVEEEADAGQLRLPEPVCP